MAEPAEEQRALEAEVDGMDTGEVHSAVESEKMDDRKRGVKELVARAFNASGSAVRLIIHPLDPDVEWCLTVRFCDSSFNRKVDTVTLWKFQEGEIDQRELFCSFAPAVRARGLVGTFVVSSLLNTSGRNVRSATSKMLPTEYKMKMGSMVIFQDKNSDVLRGSILSLSMYIPPDGGEAKVTVCNGQMVIFAFVFVAVSACFRMVVRSAPPRAPLPPFHPVLPLVCADRVHEQQRGGVAPSGRRS